MATCNRCNKQLSLVERLAGVCHDCLSKDHQAKLAERESAPLTTDALENPTSEREKEIAAAVQRVMITTEAAHNLDIEERIDIITAEAVLGMNIFADIGAALRDVVGGRNANFQNILRKARKTVLLDLRHEAWQLGADAVVGVDLDYSEISGGGKSMIFLVASGTAVKITKRPS